MLCNEFGLIAAVRHTGALLQKVVDRKSVSGHNAIEYNISYTQSYYARS